MPAENALVAEITVAEITPPKMSQAGKLMPARVKDTQGRVWNVWKDKFEALNITPGNSYAAMYTTRTSVNPTTGQSRADNTIVGLNPLGATPKPVHTQPVQLSLRGDDKSEDIAVLALAKVPELTALARQGDVATGVKTIKTLRLMWREYKKQAAILPSNEADFDDAIDDIPY